MTVKDWIYLAMAVGGYLVAMIAGLYAKNEAKINKATAAGKVLSVVGELATFAVQEAEHVGSSGETKREYAVEAVTQALGFLGIKGVTPIMINGAVEDAVKGMKLADQSLESKEEK